MIFGTSSYSEHGLREFFFFFFEIRVPCEVLKFMELEFHLNFFKELKFHELEYFTWNSSSRKYIYIYIYIFNFQFVITQLSKNRILKWNSIFRKLSFKTWAFPYLVWKIGQNARFFFKKKGKSPFSLLKTSIDCFGFWHIFGVLV